MITSTTQNSKEKTEVYVLKKNDNLDKRRTTNEAFDILFRFFFFFI